MKTDSFFACLASILLAAAPGVAGEAGTNSPGCRNLAFASIPRSQSRSTAGFSASQILDVTPSVELPRRPGGSEGPALEVRFYTPNGHLYLSKPVAVPPAAPGNASSRTRSWERVALPPLPVGGTPIVTSSLYGRWRVALLPEGAPACSGSFVLRP